MATLVSQLRAEPYPSGIQYQATTDDDSEGELSPSMVVSSGNLQKPRNDRLCSGRHGRSHPRLVSSSADDDTGKGGNAPEIEFFEMDARARYQIRMAGRLRGLQRKQFKFAGRD